jgi:enoyl-CoA hydratase
MRSRRGEWKHLYKEVYTCDRLAQPPTPAIDEKFAEEQMSDYEFIKVSRPSKGIFEILLNRPEKRNAINPGLRAEWYDAIDQADNDTEVRVVVLRGAGPVFCAGGDMKEGVSKVLTGKAGYGSWTGALPRPWHLRKALVAGVHKYSGPEAFNLLGYCDFIIAADGTRFSFEAARSGGDGATSPIMSIQLPFRVMKKLYMMGGWFDAQQALKWDFVQRVVPEADLERETYRWAEELCKIPAEQIKHAKDHLHRIYELMGLANIVTVRDRSPGQTAEKNLEFYKMIEEKGMKEALRFRDSQFDPELGRV